MEFSSQYDFIILGEHPAGLWAARHLLALEKKVLILPLGRDPGSNVAPRKVMTDFGWTDFERGEDHLQILTPERRFRLGSSEESLAREYEFQFGEKPGGARGWSP
ncbi:hypothetical protein EB061_13600, partial [bacterium]|nr:hypothetical protein [bacterium]